MRKEEQQMQDIVNANSGENTNTQDTYTISITSSGNISFGHKFSLPTSKINSFETSLEKELKELIAKYDKNNDDDTIAKTKTIAGTTTASKRHIQMHSTNLNLNDFEIYKPEESIVDTNDDEAILKSMKKQSRDDIRRRIPRILGVTLFPIIFFILLYVFEDFGITQLLGYYFFGILLLYYISVYGVLLIPMKDPNRFLYRVYSVNGRINDWTKMSITYRLVLMKTQAIESISEFCAIQGGIVHTSFLTIGMVGYCVILFSMFYETFGNGKHNVRDDFTFYDICEMLVGIGLSITPTFHLDPFNKMMKTGHYIGVVLMVFGFVSCIGQAYLFARFYNYYTYLILPSILVVVTVLCFGFYAFSLWQTERFYKQLKENGTDIDNIGRDDRIKLTRLSLLNVLAESLAIAGVSTAAPLYLINYEKCYEVSDHGCIYYYPS